MIRILIVDDQALVREGMASLLSLEEDLDVIGQGCNGEEACAMTDALMPDVILMDVRMRGVRWWSPHLVSFTLNNPNIKIIILTTFDEEEYIMLALQKGASGYLLKDTPSEQVAAVIRSVKAGHTLLGPTITPKVLLHLTAPRTEPRVDYKSILTTREIDVLKLLGQGKSNREIAKDLNITEGTVKNHITKIFNQVGSPRSHTGSTMGTAEPDSKLVQSCEHHLTVIR